jgi:nickel-type superoxide dismutase maturation protease
VFTFLRKIALLSPIYKYKISGTSMTPTIAASEYVLVNRLAYLFGNPKINDIIALRDPRDGKILTKRITKKLEDKYFVEGDNKTFSTDSRVFGWIKKRDIIGKAIGLS